MRCAECSFVYANLSSTVIEEANFAFDQDCAAACEEYQTWIDETWFESIVKRVTQLVGPGRVLDVGCGNGRLLTQFMSLGWEAEGVDPSPWAAEFAGTYGYRLHAVTLERAGLPSESFDAVTCTSTLEHVASPADHVREIMRILRPGGVAYVAGMPNHGSLAVRLGVSAFLRNVPPEHVNYFTRDTLGRIMSTPKLRKQVSWLSIRSYGIPELHRAYLAIQDASRTLLRKSRAVEESSARLAKRESAPDRIASAARRLLAKPLVSAYYHSGRPLGLGDKLELIVKKKG